MLRRSRNSVGAPRIGECESGTGNGDDVQCIRDCIHRATYDWINVAICQCIYLVISGCAWRFMLFLLAIAASPWFVVNSLFAVLYKQTVFL